MTDIEENAPAVEKEKPHHASHEEIEAQLDDVEHGLEDNIGKINNN